MAMAHAYTPSRISPFSSSSSDRRRPFPTGHHQLSSVRCSKTLNPTAMSISNNEPPPAFDSITAFAPATVANLGPGFDFLGAAVSSLGDTVTLTVDPSVHPGTLSISSITSSDSVDPSVAAKLSKNPALNCAGIAAAAAMARIGVRSVGLSLSLHKGLPLGSGLGSSAASAAAAVKAVDALFGSRLSSLDLILAGLESEKAVSGYHADNIAPAVIGGFVLVQSYSPFKLLDLRFPDDKSLFFVLVSPDFEAPTKKMRAALPADIAMKDHVFNASQAAALVVAVLRGDVEELGAAMGSDRIVEPRRAGLIPGMIDVKRAAVEAGAFGCTISGAGPTAVAVIDREEKGREIGESMVEAFYKKGGLRAKATVAQLDRQGARVIRIGRGQGL
ncbi:putative homoserine kinase [Iris pallida]|uniref:Homoserine kinase n=1 Tax=Iris pallida TaxID=29817 RepID=A0AAX6F964_IRIPA|nr:putative homoserine kinase [Iris pallida]